MSKNCEEDEDIVENLFGVYLLYCMNPKFTGRTYIGYTVNPNRRIKQHNAGKDHGGAWKTSNRGPWNMVLFIHGFLNSTSALRFEWAWQHPHLSRRLKHLPKKKSRQSKFEYCLMVLSEMLNVGPWHRLPLTVRWLDAHFARDYSAVISPPSHMPICSGKIIPRKISKSKSQQDEAIEEVLVTSCCLCNINLTEEEKVTCTDSNCILIAHLICLANILSKDDMLLPVEGTCPECGTQVLWADLIRKKIGCYSNLQEKGHDNDLQVDEGIKELDL